MRIKVLLVDDEKEFIDVLAERLEILDFEVSKAFSGNDALSNLEGKDVDVVVLDVLMPGKDGVVTLGEIKRMRPLTEVIMLTGHATVNSAVEGLKGGAYDYLMKPTETKELVNKIVKAHKRKTEKQERIRQAEIDNIILTRGWS
ncbi:MAG: response regulator [Syntrophobacteraceae bacterium]